MLRFFSKATARLVLRLPHPVASKIVRTTWARLPRPDSESEVRLPSGALFTVNPRMSGVEAALYYHGFYEAGTLRILREASRGGVLFDVGAHIGLMTAWCADSTQHVHAFEPHPTTASRLRSHVGAIPNVTVHELALGLVDDDGWMSDDGDSGESSLHTHRPNQHRVRVRSLDSIAAEVGYPDVIKLDIQGWEQNVLEGGKTVLSKGPLVCWESSRRTPEQASVQQATYDTMISYGYSVYQLKGGKDSLTRLIPVTALPHHDNLFGFLPRHREALQNRVAL